MTYSDELNRKPIYIELLLVLISSVDGELSNSLLVAQERMKNRAKNKNPKTD